MAIPTLTMIPSGYKAGKLYSVLPTNGNGDFTTSRSSSATRVNKSGLIETVLSNVPRLDYSDGSCPSLLLEPQSTNLVSYSEQFQQSSWGKVGINVTADNTISPSGILNADKIQRTSTSGNYIFDTFSKTTSQIEYTTSVFIKQGSGDYFALRYQGNYTDRIDIRFQFSTKSIYYTNEASSNAELISTSVKEYSNGWFKISYSYLSDTRNIFQSMFSPRNTNGNVDGGDNSSNAFVYLWGAQVEENSYLTSYIPTNGSEVTRSQDTANGAGDASTFNSSEGVLYAEIKSFTNDISSYQSIQLGVSGSSVNRVGLGYSSTGNLFVYKHNGVTSWNSQYSSNLKTYNKIAITYSNTVNSFWLNGVKIATNTSVGELTSQPNILSFNSPTSSERFYGNTKDLRYYNTALTDAELQELTTI